MQADRKIKRLHDEWDTILGQNWDLMPPRPPNTFNHAIRSLKLHEVRYFGYSMIKVQLLCHQDNYQNDPNYRAAISNNCTSVFD